MKRLISIICLTVSILGLFSACKGEGEYRYTVYGTFDTAVEIISYTSSADAEKYGKLAEHQLQYWHRLCDAYHPYDQVTGIYEINRRAGEWVEISDDLWELLCFGKEAFVATDGVVNLMGGAVTSLWKDTDQPPEKVVLTEAMRHIRIESLELQEGRVRLSDPYARIDVGAFAKGYALEQTARALKEEGFTGLISATSSVVAVGDKNGSPFAVGIAHPLEGGLAARAQLQNASLSTSGVDQRFFTYEGKEYHHIIDLSTGYPAEDGAIQATAIHTHGAWADVWSTAMLITGKAEGKALLLFADGSQQNRLETKE